MNQEIVKTVANTGSSTTKDFTHIKRTVSAIEDIITNDITSILQATKDFRQQFELLQNAVMQVIPETSAVTEQVLKSVVETSTEEKATEKNMQLTLNPRPAVLQPAVDSMSTLDDSMSVRRNSLQNDFTDISISPRCLCRKWKSKTVKEINEALYEFSARPLR